MHLTVEELELLVAALKAWEIEPMQHQLLFGMISMSLALPEEKARIKSEFECEAAKASAEGRMRSDVAAVLRGKLVSERMGIEKLSASQVAAERKGGWHGAGGR